jgi:hypothetical protein
MEIAAPPGFKYPGTIAAAGGLAHIFHEEALRGRTRNITLRICDAEPGRMVVAVGTETMILGFLTVHAGDTEQPEANRANIRDRQADQLTWAPTFEWSAV